MIVLNDAPHWPDGVVKVHCIGPGEVSARDVAAKKVHDVQMPSGSVIKNCGPELTKMALQNGGKIISTATPVSTESAAVAPPGREDWARDRAAALFDAHNPTAAPVRVRTKSGTILALGGEALVQAIYNGGEPV